MFINKVGNIYLARAILFTVCPFMRTNFAAPKSYKNIVRPEFSSKCGSRTACKRPPRDARKEFFTHPMTIEKNNGFLNILTGVTLFTLLHSVMYPKPPAPDPPKVKAPAKAPAKTPAKAPEKKK